MKDLKPCPFCGGEPVTKVETTYMALKENRMLFSITCKDCGVTRTSSLNTINGDTFKDVEIAIETATRRWNERAYETEDTI